MMIKNIQCVCAAAILGIMTSACDSTPGSNKVIPDFVKSVNAQSKETGVSAFVNDELLVLNYTLKNTPENFGKAIIMIESEAAREVFCESLVENLEEGPVIDRVIEEGKNLAFCVTVDELELQARFTPSELRKMIKKK